MDNCEVYSTVDFGNGPVEIRCTQKGPHLDHICHVVIGRKHGEHVAMNIFDPEDVNSVPHN